MASISADCLGCGAIIGKGRFGEGAIGDGAEASCGIVGVACLGFDSGTVFQIEAGGAQEVVLGAVDDAGEFGGAIGIEVMGYGFGIQDEGCRIVGVCGFRDGGARFQLRVEGRPARV